MYFKHFRAVVSVHFTPAVNSWDVKTDCIIGTFTFTANLVNNTQCPSPPSTVHKLNAVCWPTGFYNAGRSEAQSLRGSLLSEDFLKFFL